MRRLLIVILVLVVLVAAVAVTVQAVLWSDLPRSIVETQLQRATGLEVEIGGLSTGWGGRTEVEGVVMGLPLEDEPFLRAPSLELDHTALLKIVVTRSFEAEDVRIVDPVVQVEQWEDGRWNLQQVQEVLEENLPEPDPERRPEPLPLPRLRLSNATVVVQAHDREAVELEGIEVEGEREGGLGYRFAAEVPGIGEAGGRVSRARPFVHEVAFDLQPSEDLTRALVGRPVAERWRGRWRGRAGEAGVRGRLELEEGTVPGARLSGIVEVQVRAEDQTVVLQPRPLSLDTEAGLPEPVHLSGGRIRLAGLDVSLESLRATGFGGVAMVRGELDLVDLTGEVHASWEEVGFPEEFEHGGELALRLAQQGPGRRVVTGRLATAGDGSEAAWEGELYLEGSGQTLDELEGTLTAAEFRAAVMGTQYDLTDLEARFGLREPTLVLHELRVDEREWGTRLAGSGEMDWSSGEWGLRLRGQEVKLPVAVPALGQVQVEVGGDPERIALERAAVTAVGMAVEARGAYVYAEPEPLALEVALEELPIHVGAAEQAVVSAENVAGDLEVRGTLQPLDVRAEGQLLAEMLQVQEELLGDIEVGVQAEANEEAARFAAEAIEWLGGDWAVHGAFRMHEGSARLSVDATDIDLTLADRLLETPTGIELGLADLSLEAEGLAGAWEESTLRGEYELRELTRWPVEVDRLGGQLRFRGGRLELHDVEAESGEGRLRAAVGLDVDAPTVVDLEAELEDWPLLLTEDGERLAVAVDAATSLRMDVPRRAGFGRGRLGVEAATGDFDMGRVEVDFSLSESMLHLQALRGRTLEGRIDGMGRINLRRPTYSELEVQWDGVQVQRLEGAMPGLLGLGEVNPATVETVREQLRGIEGAVSGSLRMFRTDDPRALGPVRVDFDMESDAVTVADLPIGSARARAYLDDDRVVLEDLTVEAIGGRVGLWGRVSRRNGELFAFMRGALDEVDLAVLTQPGEEDEAPDVLGLVSGDVTVSAPVGDFRNAFGRGSLQIRESDLADIPLISILFDLADVSFITGRDPTGQGTASFRLEDGRLLIERFRYRNRGVTIGMQAELGDLWAGMDSPIRGQAVASASPLPDLEFVEVVNQALVALWQDVAFVRLEGTVREPVPRPVALPGLQDELRRMLGIQRREQRDQEILTGSGSERERERVREREREGVE